MSDIYKLKASEVADFAGYNGTKKVIVYHKQACIFCKSQIGALKKLAELYCDGIEYAVCDVENEASFCIDNGIAAVPVIQMYKDGALVKQLSSCHPFEKLEKEVAQAFDFKLPEERGK